MSKIYAIGDVHGCNSLLIKLLAAINPQKHDTVIFLGDVIDRGEDSKGVLDTIIQYQSICQVILIQGNHEEMMLGAVQEKLA
jgi:serine/threonine protein phosphatase 1